jgi:hypothetical protein
LRRMAAPMYVWAILASSSSLRAYRHGCMRLRLASFDESPYRQRTPRKLGTLHVHGAQGVGDGRVSPDGAGGSSSLHAARGARRRVSVWAIRNAGISSAVGTRESITEPVSHGPSASYFSSDPRAYLNSNLRFGDNVWCNSTLESAQRGSQNNPRYSCSPCQSSFPHSTGFRGSLRGLRCGEQLAP